MVLSKLNHHFSLVRLALPGGVLGYFEFVFGLKAKCRCCPFHDGAPGVIEVIGVADLIGKYHLWF